MDFRLQHGEHEHAHGARVRLESSARMTRVLILTGSYMVLQVAAGIYTGSLALLADAGHMLTDMGSILLALLAFWFASRPSSVDKTYGYYRSEILAGLVNGIALVGVSLLILYEAWQRLSDPPRVMSGPVLVVALAGLAVNLASARILHGTAQQSLNVKAAYLEVLSDLLATLGVIAAALIMMATGWYLADPIISGLIGLMILPRTWGLLSECTNILMEGAPGHIDLMGLRAAMLKVPGVVDVHDIHVWTITSGRDAMSAHVTIDSDSSPEAVLTRITEIAQHDFGIHHTTTQVEQVQCKGQATPGCN